MREDRGGGETLKYYQSAGLSTFPRKETVHKGLSNLALVVPGPTDARVNALPD